MNPGGEIKGSNVGWGANPHEVVDQPTGHGYLLAPYKVTFDAEKRLKHAATLFIVLAYVYIGLFGLMLILLLGNLDQGY